MESIFIHYNEDVRTWLLSNSILDDPLDLMGYCYRDRNDKRQNTAEPSVLSISVQMPAAIGLVTRQHV